MGISKKTDGRYVVGLGVTTGNDYKGSASYRDIYIQLTADGATTESMEYLTYLKDYAEYSNANGEPIMPPSVNVWISNNGTTTAVEADDLSLDDGVYTICGIKYEDGAWDFTNAGQHSGGGGGSSLPSYDSGDAGKVLTVSSGGTGVEWATASGGGGGIQILRPMKMSDAPDYSAYTEHMSEDYDPTDPDAPCPIYYVADNVGSHELFLVSDAGDIVLLAPTFLHIIGNADGYEFDEIAAVSLAFSDYNELSPVTPATGDEGDYVLTFKTTTYPPEISTISGDGYYVANKNNVEWVLMPK